MKERAKSQEDTRLRIIEATMHLHERIGPRETTISAIAERAGVQRLTVYRHFSDENAVFQACTAYWLGLNPPPDPRGWVDIADPCERMRSALGALYRYYSGTRRMWSVSHRDVADVPALQGPMAEFAAFVRDIADDLAAAFAGQEGARPDALSATIRHAVTFPTWEELEGQSIDDDEKIELVSDWVAGTLRRTDRLKS